MATKQEKLIQTLKNMFQFDQADLDFGIYRIMSIKREEISIFLEDTLPKQIADGLKSLQAVSNEKEIAALCKQIEDTSMSSLSDSVKMAALKDLEAQKEILESGKIDISATEADIYNHLANFFSRYYDSGDFISQRRYKDGAYVIPYEGEEVKLHWANADQYYIKSSEYFKDYIFKHDNKSVCFKIIDAETEKDNNKSDKKRFFQLHTKNPFDVQNDSLFIHIEYKNGDKKQEDYIQEVRTTFEDNRDVLQAFPRLLDIENGKTILEKYLTKYTARNTHDYFIHKDLGKFLRRELDFYIKNDVIFLDDFEEQDERKLKTYVTKAKVISAIGKKIITFLAQIEDFQKKLWLKKKFVAESQYCITLDNIDERFYDDVITNDAQREEWVRLFAIDEINGVMGSNGYSVPLSKEFLKNNKYLVLDTKFFSVDCKERLLASIDDLDERTDGLLIHSENFQALNLLQEKYKEQVKCVYIDPPYNTNASKIIYKNGYEHSSWVSLIDSRLELAKMLMNDKSIIQVAIDDYEFRYVNILMDKVFGVENAISNIAILTNPKGRDQDFIAQAHDYTIIYAKEKNTTITYNFILSEEEMKKKFSKIKAGENVRELPLKRTGSGKFREERPYMFFPFLFNIKTNELTVLPLDEYKKIYDPNTKSFDDEFLKQMKSDYESKGYAFILPTSQQGDFFRWRWGYDTCNVGCANGALFAKKTQDSYSIYQYDIGDNEVAPKSLWTGEKYDASSKGTNLLENIIPKNPFDYPKSLYTVKDSIRIGTSITDFALDFFAGSGTTAHAVINLNREDSGKRKYILVEMGEYFNTVTKPRVQKVIYSDEWKNGKPTTRKGSSHIMKYMRLESYEDTLNNITLKKPQQARLLGTMGAIAEEYLLSYMLEIESRGSASLLSLDSFARPFDYQMAITQKQQSSLQHIDLVESFNYLIGLYVERNFARTGFDADFSHLEGGALQAKLKEGNTYILKMLEGKNRDGEKILVIWRNMTGDSEKDNAVLDAFFLKRRISSTDIEYDKIYVNGDNNLPNIRSGDETWRVILIEEEMKRRMFEDS